MSSQHVLIPSAGVKAGNRQDAKECLDFAARGLVKAHYQLRPMESLTEVSST
jgi:propanol-preferring alcohol dehydrogenase